MQETRNFLNVNEDKSFLLYLLSKNYIEGNTKLVKLIFLANYLAKKEDSPKPFHYNFFHYKFGPYSKWIQNDVNNLILSGLIKKQEGNEYVITDKGRKVLSKLEDNLEDKKKKIIQKVIDEFSDKDTKFLLDYVYDLEEYKLTKYGEKINLD